MNRYSGLALGAVVMLGATAHADTITYTTTGTAGASTIVLTYSYDTTDMPLVPGGQTWALNPANVSLLIDGVDQGAATLAQHGVTLTAPGPIGDDRYLADFEFGGGSAAGGLDMCFCWVDDIDPTSGFVTGPMLPGAAFDPFAAALNEWFINFPSSSVSVNLTGFEVESSIIPLPTGAAMGAVGIGLIGFVRRRRTAI